MGRYKFLLFAFSLMSLVSCTSAPTDKGNDKSADKTPKELSQLYLELGTQALLRGEPPQAVVDLRKSVDYDSNNTIALNHLGLAYYALGKKDLAEKTITKAIDLDPMYSDAHINLGNFAFERSDYKLARFHFEQAMDNLEYKFRHRALTSLGRLSLRENKIDEAKQFLYTAIQINPDYCMAHFLLGSIYTRENNATKATEEFKKSIISTCAKDVEAQYQLGLAYIKSKDFEKARKQLVYVMEQFPQSGQAKKAGDTLRNIP